MSVIRHDTEFWPQLDGVLGALSDEVAVFYMKQSPLVVMFDPTDEDHGLVIARDHLRVRNLDVWYYLPRDGVSFVAFEKISAEVEGNGEGEGEGAGEAEGVVDVS